MSGPVNASLGVQIMSRDDQRTTGPEWVGIDQPAEFPFPVFLPEYDPVGFGKASYGGAWWPADDVCVGDTGGAVSGVIGGCSWGTYATVSGANARLAIVGYARGYDGSPIAGVTVKLFRTTDDSLQCTQVTDGNGAYTLTTPYADGHYVTMYKAGPPDYCGTTINTLAPA
jgi:hypothetical protein